MHDSLGFTSLMLYCQDKQVAAPHEQHDIEQISGEEFQPEISWLNPPVIQHGNLFFAILICSELTNIAYRSFLRGKIDVLFIPAWNKDLETFNALVESAALDVHAYISVCNDSFLPNFPSQNRTNTGGRIAQSVEQGAKSGLKLLKMRLFLLLAVC